MNIDADPSIFPASNTIFAERADRLRQLAHGHSQSAWLVWTAALCDVQQRQFNAAPGIGIATPITGEFPLNNVESSLREHARQRYAALIAALKTQGHDFPRTVDGITDSEWTSRAQHTLAIAQGHQLPTPGRDLRDILIAAAMQIAWTSAARTIDVHTHAGHAARDVCPICASAPVASIILAGEGRAGQRLLECNLCATRWRIPRAHCVFCEEGDDVAYLGLEGNETVQAETCKQCHGYIKTMFQTKSIHTQPLADDLATLALDVLVGEKGYGRGSVNLLVLEGEHA